MRERGRHQTHGMVLDCWPSLSNAKINRKQQHFFGGFLMLLVLMILLIIEIEFEGGRVIGWNFAGHIKNVSWMLCSPRMMDDGWMALSQWFVVSTMRTTSTLGCYSTSLLANIHVE